MNALPLAAERSVAGDLSAPIVSDHEPTPTLPHSDEVPAAAAEWPTVPGYHILAVQGRCGC
jgi:hypothetical protein